jgi:hypothetical protein
MVKGTERFKKADRNPEALADVFHGETNSKSSSPVMRLQSCQVQPLRPNDSQREDMLDSM